jgi:hypothetical protein
LLSGMERLGCMSLQEVKRTEVKRNTYKENFMQLNLGNKAKQFMKESGAQE